MLKRPAVEANKKFRVQFYTKEGCPLCDEAREILHGLGLSFPLEIKEIDITSDSTLFEKYKNIIPVVVIDGKHVFGARISEEELRACLQELKRGAR